MANMFGKNTMPLDLMLCFVGLFIGFISAAIFYILDFSFIDVSLTLFFACLVYFVIKSNNAGEIKKYRCWGTKHIITFNLSFLLLTLILINEIYLFNNVIFLYSIIIILSCLVVLEFISLPSTTSYSSLILIKIFIIALILRWNLYFQYPSYIGVDAWYHGAMIADIIKFEHLPIGYAYSKYPVMHLVVSAGSLMSNITIKNSMVATIGLFEIICLIYVFLIGKSVSSTKTGILATLLVAVSGYHISWGYYIIAMSLGLSIFTTIFYILLRVNSPMGKKFKVLLILHTFLIIITHTISTVIMCLFVILNYITTKVCSKNFKYSPSFSLSLPLIVLISTLGYWMYSTGFIGYVVLSIQSSLMISEVDSIVANPIAVNLFERQLNRIEMLLFLGFTIIGSLYWFSERIDDVRRLVLMVCGATFTVVIFSSIFIGIDSILPDRWYAFLYVILANISAAGIIYYIDSFKNNNLRAYFLVIIVALFTIFAITSAAANGGSAAYSNEQTKNELTESDLYSYNTLSRMYSGKVTSDGYSNLYFKHIAKLPTETFEPYNLTNGHGLTILRIDYLRSSIISIPVPDKNEHGYGGYEGTFVKLDAIDFDLLYGDKYSKIYDSKSISGYY